MRILAVDDSPISRDLLPVLFSSSGFPPLHVAESGRAALAILGKSEQAFDCLILDIEMPGMDGIELCSRVRQLARYREVPIIMLTARDDAQTIETAFAAGANDYILKSTAAKELVGRVHVAQRMLRRNECKVLSSRDLVQGEPSRLARSGKHSFSLADSLLIEGVDRVILPFSLGNYLTQLPVEALAGTRIFGVQIEDPVRHYHDNTTRNFTDILARVANGIGAAVDTDRLLMSYNGGGRSIASLATSPESSRWNLRRTSTPTSKTVPPRTRWRRCNRSASVSAPSSFQAPATGNGCVFHSIA